MILSDVLRAVGFAFLIALLLAATVCLSPIRWDIKSFGPILPAVGAGTLEPGADVLYVSASAGAFDRNLVAYGLDVLTFPDGRKEWLALMKTDSDASRATFLLDETGVVFEAGGGDRPLVSRPERLLRFERGGTVLAASEEVRTELSSRWPELAVRALVPEAPRRSFLARPGLRIRPSQLARLFVVAGLAVLWYLVVLRWRAQSVSLGLDTVLAVPTAVMFHTWLVTMVGRLTAHPVPWSLLLEAIVTAGLAGAPRLGMGRISADARARKIPGPGSEPVRVILAVAGVLCFLGIATIRRDLDGDVFTHWLPMARSHHALGTHDVDALVERYGTGHEASYPPGFPILMSTCMWIAGLPRGAAMPFSLEWNLTIFLYRLALAVLSLAFLVAVAILFRMLSKRPGDLVWLLPAVAVALLVPLFLGQPRAGEVYLVPIVGFALVAMTAGESVGSSGHWALGAGLAAFALLIKNDAILVLPFLLLPWYLAGRVGDRRRTMRSLLWDLGVFFTAAVPFVLWRLDLAGADIVSTFEFGKVDVGRLWTGAGLLAATAQNALEIVIKSGSWPVFFLAVPLRSVLHWLRTRRRASLLAPAAIYLYLAAATVIYMFSTKDPMVHMDLSYDRLIQVAVVAGVIYASRGLIEDRAEGVVR